MPVRRRLDPDRPGAYIPHRMRNSAGRAERRHEIRTLRRRPGARRPGRRQRGLPSFHQLRDRGRKVRLFQRLPGRASFHRLRPGLGVLEPALLSGGAHRADPSRHRGRRAALAQPGAGRRGGGDPRSAVERPARFRRRQRLSAVRVFRLLHPAGRGDRALRRSDRRHPPGPGPARAGSPTAAPGGITTTSSSNPPRSSSRTRPFGSAPAAPSRSAAPRARATICCSTRSRRSM